MHRILAARQEYRKAKRGEIKCLECCFVQTFMLPKYLCGWNNRLPHECPYVAKLGTCKHAEEAL